jgi:hypothetical protein
VIISPRTHHSQPSHLNRSSLTTQSPQTPHPNISSLTKTTRNNPHPPKAADCEQGEYVKDQMGLEALSHHLLPLIRYRRAKARKAQGYYAPELTAVPAKATPAAL